MPPFRHGLSMHGEPALPAGFSALPYVNVTAPRGGRLVVGLQGTFDSLNAFVVRGVAPDAWQKYVGQSLLMRSPDEPFTAYGLVADGVAVDTERTEVTFRLCTRMRAGPMERR